ncbi:MAG TPA: polymorphic toxin type 33 domain-containing protein [Chthoniobacterales bacterium]
MPLLAGIGVGMLADWGYDAFLDPLVQDFINKNFDPKTAKTIRSAGDLIDALRSLKNPIKALGKLGIKRLSKGEIKKLKQAGLDPHDLKPNSKYDLFKDDNGDHHRKAEERRRTW